MFVNINIKGWQETWLWPVLKYTAGYRLEIDRTQFFLQVLPARPNVNVASMGEKRNGWTT